MHERMPEHQGLRMMEERAHLALSGRTMEPCTPSNSDQIVRLKRKENGRSFHLSVPRSQVGLWMNAQA